MICHPRAFFARAIPVARLIVGIVLALGLSVQASAGEFTARIQSILVYEDGDLVYVYPEGGVKTPPACHGSNGDYTSFKLNRPRAREYFAALLGAQLAGKTVLFRTIGACVDQSVSDTLSYFKVNS